MWEDGQRYLRAQWLLFPPLRISHLSEERHFFRFDPLKENMDLQMNSVVYPLDYATWRGGHQHTVQLIINLAEEPLLLAEGDPTGIL